MARYLKGAFFPTETQHIPMKQWYFVSDAINKKQDKFLLKHALNKKLHCKPLRCIYL